MPTTQPHRGVPQGSLADLPSHRFCQAWLSRPGWCQWSGWIRWRMVLWEIIRGLLKVWLLWRWSGASAWDTSLSLGSLWVYNTSLSLGSLGVHNTSLNLGSLSVCSASLCWTVLRRSAGREGCLSMKLCRLHVLSCYIECRDDGGRLDAGRRRTLRGNGGLRRCSAGWLVFLLTMAIRRKTGVAFIDGDFVKQATPGCQPDV